MRKTLAVLAASAGLLLCAAPMWAHHAFAAEFDEKKPIKLHGVVTKWELVNPHSWIHLDVKNPDGTVTAWTIEGGSPNALFRLGIHQEFAAGGHGTDHRRLSGEGWGEPRRRRQADVHGRQEPVPEACRRRGRSGRQVDARPSPVSCGGGVVRRKCACGQVLGQAPQTWTPPKTPDGQPDLSGYWTNITLTPLQRPANLCEQAVFHSCGSRRLRKGNGRAQ